MTGETMLKKCPWNISSRGKCPL